MLPKRKKDILLFFLRDKNKKGWFQIIREFTSLCFLHKELPVYYITNLLYRKGVTNYKDYLSLKENTKLLEWSYAHAKEQIILAEDKVLFEELLVRSNIPTPKIFFHNLKNKFTYKKDVFEIENIKDFFSFLETVFNETGVERFFCKPVDGSKGQNIFVLDRNTFKNSKNTLINLILSQAFIFQELILQHESLKKINKSSVNTLRIVTYKNKRNEVEILSGLIRLGRHGSIVDNASAGGILVSINKKTGKMREEGMQLIDNGGGVFYKHPDTGVIFNNFQIPCFAKAMEIVKKASVLLKFPLLGWDIAITPDGPIIVEVNHNFHLPVSDRMEKGLKNISSFNKLLQRIE